MFAITLHRVLALLSAAAVLLAAGEAAERAWRRRPAGALAPRLLGVALVLIASTGAGGLALWLQGPGPREPLHLLYGVLAFVMMPLADALALRGGPQAQPRARGLARAAGALVTLVLIARLLATG
jgi:hypothetical protein